MKDNGGWLEGNAIANVSVLASWTNGNYLGVEGRLDQFGPDDVTLDREVV